MDEKQLTEFRQTLTTRRTEIVSDLERLDLEIESLGVEQEQERGGTGNHLADDGSSVMEQERIGTMSEDFRDLLRQIDDALTRLDNGTYGTCLRCGKLINPERLEAVPYVEYDIECQSILERERHLHGSTSRAG